jgi:hypothetical protein
MVGTFGLLLVVHALITNVLIRILSLWHYQHAEFDLRRREQSLADSGSPVATLAGPDKLLIELTQGS